MLRSSGIGCLSGNVRGNDWSPIGATVNEPTEMFFLLFF